MSMYYSNTWPRAFVTVAAVIGVLACRDKEADSSSDSSDTSETDETDTGEFVNPCAEGTIHIDDAPTAYPSIQDALNVIEEGSTLYVCPGIHYEALSFLSYHNPTFESDGTIYIVGHSAEDTIIDADGQGPVLRMYNLNIEVSDLTLTGGTGYEYYSDHNYYSDGGAILNNNADITMNRVTIEGNSASLGGGILTVGSGSYPVIILNNCIVRNNVAEGDDDDEPPYGGGIFLGGQVRLESYATDWGEGANDNEPEDVLVTFRKVVDAVYNFGADASFICDTANKDEPCQVLK